ncbi:MAG: hypothetical protein JJ992_22845 [Planctomycetes bacterium]|nr:hypothetical protein [Planctomycetota bacterium]
MVIRECRVDFAAALRQLVAGEMTNDQFDDAYDEKWYDSEDTAVREIAKFGWGLYSSDLLIPYQLKGRHAVSNEVRDTADGAIAFLQSDLEYEWPSDVDGVIPFWCLWGPGFYLCFAIAFFAFAVAYPRMPTAVPWLLGVASLISPIHWLITHSERKHQLEEFYASGDFSIWPFMNREDLNRADS